MRLRIVFVWMFLHEIRTYCWLFFLGYEESIEDQIYGDTSADFMNLLLDIIHAARKPESTPIDDQQTKKLIHLIANAKNENYLFKSSILTIFSRESYRQIYHVISNFSNVTGQTIQQAIKEIPKNRDYVKALLTIGN